MRFEENSDLDKRIFIVLLIISVVFIAKVVFWLSICSFVAGILWYVKARGTKHQKTAALVAIVSLILIPITYVIGFHIENVPMFNAVYDFLVTAPDKL